jgi:hypothetical protein
MLPPHEVLVGSVADRDLRMFNSMSDLFDQANTKLFRVNGKTRSWGIFGKPPDDRRNVSASAHRLICAEVGIDDLR